MPRKKSAASHTDEELYQALFALIAREGWWALTLPKIAKALKIKLPELLKTYPDKNALLAGFLSFIDQRLAEHTIEETDSLKERLFEILMLRFEAMQPFRPGLTRLLDEAMADPISGICLAIEMAPSARRAAKLMLDLADFPARKPLRELAIGGLKLVYLHALRTWKNDQSPDLSATMAALDRGLNRLLSLLGVQA